MCIRCITNDMMERMDNYPFNRDVLLVNLYKYFDYNDSRKTEKGLTEELDERLDKQYNDLKQICNMIESGEEKEEIQSKLQILELTCDFTQRDHFAEEHRKYKNKRLYDT